MDTRPRRNLARFFLLSFALFCLFLPVWRLISPLYTSLLANFAHPLLPGLTTGVDGQEVEFFSRTKGTTVFLVDPRGVTEANVDQAPAISFDTRHVHFNVPLLLALFLATPGLLRGRYWKQLGIALGVLFLWHAGYVSLVLHRLAAQVASAGPSTAGKVLHMRTNLPYEMLLSLFIPQLLPFLLWIGLFHFRQPPLERDNVISTPTVGRNDSCPCGSGRKYKRCCGATDKG